MNNYKLKKGGVQHGFAESRVKIQVMGGGYGNGKTTALSLKALRLIADYPGSTGLLGRATFPKLRTTLQRVFFDWCPPDWIKKYPTKDENTCHFTNGSIVDFRYINQRGRQQADGQTSSNLLSATYDWVGIDQVEDPEITHKDILDLLGRLRGDTPYRPEGYDDKTMPHTGPRWMMLTCNPTANWFFKEMINPLLVYKARGVKLENLPVHPVTGEPIIELFEGSTYTNADNLSPDYITTLEAMYHGQMRERFLMGGWAAFEGLVYPEFDISLHGITREDALAHLEDCRARHVEIRFIESYDFGIAQPTCYMLAFVDEWGRVIILDGFYRPNFSYTLHRPMIETIRARYEIEKIDDPVNADPSIYKHRVIDGHRDTGHVVADLLASDGLRTRPANNDIVSGVAKINAYLADKQDVPHLTIEDRKSSPLLYVVDDLTWFQDEIVNYYWKRDTQGRQIDEPQEHNDHAMDATKYLLAYLPAPSEIKPPAPKQPPPYMLWHEVEMRA